MCTGPRADSPQALALCSPRAALAHARDFTGGWLWSLLVAPTPTPEPLFQPFLPQDGNPRRDLPSWPSATFAGRIFPSHGVPERVLRDLSCHPRSHFTETETRPMEGTGLAPNSHWVLGRAREEPL